MGFTVKRVLRRVLRRGSEKGLSRRCLERPLEEYAPLGVRPIYDVRALLHGRSKVEALMSRQVAAACAPDNEVREMSPEELPKVPPRSVLLDRMGTNQRKTTGQRLEGKIVRHFFALFHTYSEISLKIKAFKKSIKRKRPNHFAR